MATPEALQQLLPTLPTPIILDLLRLRVCLRCIFRFLSVRSPVYAISLPTPATFLEQLSSMNRNTAKEEDLLKRRDVETPEETKPCLVCLGTLEHLDHKEEEVHLQGSGDDAGQDAVLCVSRAVQQGDHTFDSYCLEISLPAVILVRERGLWCYLKDKYKNEAIFNGQDVNDHIISLKEALKWSLIDRLEQSLSVKFDANSTFRIALVYKHPGSVSDNEFLAVAAGGDAKRRRQGTGQNDPNNNKGFAAVVAARAAAEAGESLGSVQRVLASMSNDSFMRRYSCLPSEVAVSCQLTAMCWRNSIYVGGRYLKMSRNISQSRWLIDDERMGDGSVQEIIGDVVFPYHKADSYKFHAAGREDIDVRMLGNGRPFILEICNARVIPSASDMIKAEAEINSKDEGWVKVRGLRQVGSEVCALMREGETEKQKQYAAVVWLDRPVTEADFKCLSDLKELEVQQKTPIRVLHRRSPLTRPRTIHWMRCERIEGSENYFLLHLCTQAGTYIKEFVHGDLGRTYPNVGSLLGCGAEILQLDVTDVKMDFD
ncbi:unnamed protein product [Calypogeia fissa]